MAKFKPGDKVHSYNGYVRRGLVIGRHPKDKRYWDVDTERGVVDPLHNDFLEHGWLKDDEVVVIKLTPLTRWQRLKRWVAGVWNA